MTKVLLGLCCGLSLFGGQVLAAAGELDIGFAEQGWNRSSGPVVGRSSVRAVLALANGESLAAGTMAVAGSGNDFFVARYLADGSVDTSFGQNGIVTIDFNGFDDAVTDAALQPDGKIVMVGNCDGANTNRAYCFARVTAAGVIDADFGTSGKQTLSNNDPERTAGISAVTIGPNGEIFAVGGAAFDEDAFLQPGLIFKLNANGSWATDFGAAGVLTPSGSDVGALNAITVDSQNRIVAVGNSSSGTGAIVVRSSVTGMLDSTLDGSGYVELAGVSFPQAVAVQSDDKILIGHRFRINVTGNQYDAAITRIDTAGVVDASFNGDGRASLNMAYHDDIREIHVNSDDSLIIGGNARSNGDFSVRLFVAKLDQDGNWQDFGNAAFSDGDGVTVVVSEHEPLDYAVSYLRGMAVLSDQTIIANANVSGFFNGGQAAQLKLTTAGVPDESFADAGIALNAFALAGAREWLQLMAAADGGWYALGKIDSGMGALAKFQADGTLDTDFSGDGIYLFPHTDSGLMSSLRMVRTSDNAVVVLHRPMTSGAGTSFSLQKVTSTGVRDSTFSGSFFLPTQPAYIHALLKTSDDKLIVVSRPSGSNRMLWVRRLLSNGSIDTDYGSDGDQFYDLAPLVDWSDPFGGVAAIDESDNVSIAVNTGSTVRVLQLDADGQWNSDFGDADGVTSLTATSPFRPTAMVKHANGWLIGGFLDDFLNGSTKQAAVYQLDNAGLIDTNFADNGLFLLDSTPTESWVNELLLRDNGDILLVGAALSGTNQKDMLLAQLSAAGEINADFGSGGIVLLGDETLDQNGAAGLLRTADDQLLIAGNCDRVACIAGIQGWYKRAELSETVLAFASQTVNTDSASTEIELSNAGTEPLTISALLISAGFSYQENCPAVLAVGESCAISIVFNPNTVGAISGTLTVQTDAGPHIVNLTGTGLAAEQNQDGDSGGGGGGSSTLWLLLLFSGMLLHRKPLR